MCRLSIFTMQLLVVGYHIFCEINVAHIKLMTFFNIWSVESQKGINAVQSSVRSRRALWLYKANCDSAFFILNGIVLICQEYVTEQSAGEIVATANTLFLHRRRAFPQKTQTNKLLFPIQIHWVEKFKVPYKWQILSWWHLPNKLWCAV